MYHALTYPLRFDVFRPATFADVSKLITESPDTHCDLDPSYSYYSAKKCTCVLPTITVYSIINLYLFIIDIVHGVHSTNKRNEGIDEHI
jgi:hypothetical protein